MIAYSVLITKKADNDEASIYKYISSKFGESYADKFRSRILQVFRLLAQQPFVGRPAKNNPSIRVFLVSKQNKLIYKVTESEIIILRLLNTKTDYAAGF